MASTVLNAVSERRLRPIYELLDNGNYKKACHETEKVLKKQKDLIAAKVLKTIALHRMGKEEEAFDLSNEIAMEAPTDENSLQGLSLYYKEIHRTELICPLYESAVRLCPGNEEYLTHLFMAYVRHEQFQEMQRVAMLLYKQHPKNPYLFWGIMAIVLQAENTTDKKLATKMYLPLAEKMVEKHVKAGKIEAEAEVKLYLMILDLMGKHEKALEVVNGDLGGKLISDIGGRPAALLEVQKKLENWEFVNEENKKLLKQKPDVWNYALDYLDSLFHQLDIERGSLTEENNFNEWAETSTRLQEGIQFILNLITEENTLLDWKRRGPYLLRLEMLKRMKDRFGNLRDSCFGPAKQLCLEYALDFSPKPFCFSDLKPYISLLTDEEKTQFLFELKDQQSSLTSSEMNGVCDENLKNEIMKKKTKEIQRHVFTVEAARYLGEHEKLSSTEKFILAQDFLQKHEAGLKHVADRPPTDPCPVDSYCVLAARLMMDVYSDTGDTLYLWRCAYVLEYGIQHSKYNYEMKLMLIKVYCTLGAFSPCADLYDSMEVKHMQQDTLGYTVCRHVVSLGHYHHASQVFQMARNFYTNNNKESLECLITCFRNGTFYKVSEFVKYRRRIHKSYHAAYVQTEHLLMDLFTQGDIDQPVTALLTSDIKPIDYNTLVDNRDLKVVSDVRSKERQVSEEMIKKSFEHEKNWLAFRDFLLRCMYSVLIRDHDQTHNGCCCHGSPEPILPTLITQFETFCSTLHKSDIEDYPMLGPNTTRIKLSIESNYPRMMLLVFKFCCDFINLKSNPDLESQLFNNLTLAIQLLQEYVATCKEGIYSNANHEETDQSNESSKTGLNQSVPDAIININPSFVERLVICTEMFSICVLLITRLKTVVTEVKMDLQRQKRRKKGKQTNSPLPAWVSGYQSAISSYSDIGDALVGEVKKMKQDVEERMLDLGGLEIKDKEEEKTPASSETKEDNCVQTNGTVTPDDKLYHKIMKNSLESYSVSCKQMLFVLEGRMKNLKETSKV
ncbi:N-alpha-acetyltransferase 25, NatB auxiliary subunit-like [Ciona intestinalis]